MSNTTGRYTPGSIPTLAHQMVNESSIVPNGMSSMDAAYRIKAAHCYMLEYDLKGYRLSYGTINKIRNVVLKLTDTDGVVGWGEANPMQPFTDESAEDVIASLKSELLPILMRQESVEPTSFDELLDEILPGSLIAKGAISMALLDIQGKRQGVPIAQLLGKVIQRSLPVLWPLSEETAEEDTEHIESKICEGYETFMLKMGRRDENGSAQVQRQVTRIATLSYKYSSVKLIADANTGWTTEETQDFLRGIGPNQLVFLEQPISKTDFSGMATIARQSKTPISADESLTGLPQAKALIDAKACGIFSIKSSKNGGPLRAKTLCDLAEEHGLKVYMNSMLELGITQAASLQLAVTRQNLVDAGHAYMSTIRLEGDPTNFASFIRNGSVHLPDAPGLGIDVDEDVVRGMAVMDFVLELHGSSR